MIVSVFIGVHADSSADQHHWDQRVIVFSCVLVFAGAIALFHEQLFADPAFNAAHIEFAAGTVDVDGGYITTTETAVLLVTRFKNDCPTITAVRRDRIRQITIGPASVNVPVHPQRCSGEESWRSVSAQ